MATYLDASLHIVFIGNPKSFEYSKEIHVFSGHAWFFKAIYPDLAFQ